jgi:hypothetical protein
MPPDPWPPTLLLRFLALQTVAFWVLWALLPRIQLEYDAEASAKSQKVLLNGSLVPLDEFLGAHASGSASASRRLVLVGSDECGASLKQVPEWQRALAALPMGSEDEVILVSFTGTTLFEPLTKLLGERRIPFRVLKLEYSDRFRFISRTGLTSTPLTLLVDNEYRLRLLIPILQGDYTRVLNDYFGT